MGLGTSVDDPQKSDPTYIDQFDGCQYKSIWKPGSTILSSFHQYPNTMYPNYMGLYVSMNACLSHVSMDVYMHLYIPFSPSANRRVQGGESLYYMI